MAVRADLSNRRPVSGLPVIRPLLGNSHYYAPGRRGFGQRCIWRTTADQRHYCNRITAVPSNDACASYGPSSFRTETGYSSNWRLAVKASSPRPIGAHTVLCPSKQFLHGGRSEKRCAKLLILQVSCD
jgi:hypothetical protein